MRVLLLLFILCKSVAAIGQEVAVSDDISLRNDVSYELIGRLGEKYLLYHSQMTTHFVQAFDEDMQQSWEKELELDKKRPQPLGIIPATDDFSLIYYHKQQSNTHLKLHKYNAAAVLIDSLTLTKFNNQIATPTLRLMESEDYSKGLVYYMEQPHTIVAAAFDVRDPQLLWHREFRFDSLQLNRNFSQVILNDKGDVFFVFEKNNTKSKIDRHALHIEHYQAAEDELTKYNINMQSHLTYDVYFEYDNLNDKLVAGGLYAEKNRGRAEGLFYLNISPSPNRPHQLIFHPFEEEFIGTIMGKNAKVEKGLLDCDIQEIVLRRDGGILMIGERNKIYERRIASTNQGYNSRSGSPFVVDYYYDDLFVVSVHPDGRIHWKNILHKKQYSQDDDAVYSSYFLLKTPKNLRFIFNDEISYENTVSEYVIGGTGSLDRNSLMNTEDQGIQLRFPDAVQVSTDELLVPSERRNRLRLVRIKY